MSKKKEIIQYMLIGGSILLAVGFILKAITVNKKLKEPPKEDPFDTTELSTSYPYMHSEIKKQMNENTK